MISYKNKPELKEMLVKEIERHRKMDAIVQGTYGNKDDNDFKGCAVGCSIHSLNIKLGKSYDTGDHAVYEKELGIPKWLARLEDTIFEGLPAKDAKKWPEQFAKAIPVGVNLEPVKWHFCSYLMKENIDRVLKLDISEDLKKQVVDAIRQVLAVHQNAIETGKWDEAAWSAAESAAWSAAESAESAAWSAAWSAAESAESAAWSAAWSAARSARSAAWSAESAAWSAESAARSAAWSAAWSAAYIKHSKELLKLLKQAK